MNEQNNPYNQVPQGPMMPPPPPPMAMPPMQPTRRRRNWKQRLLEGTNTMPLTLRQERSLPEWVVGKSVLFFFIAFVACTMVWGHPMEMRYAIISSLSILLFFYGCKSFLSGAVRDKEKTFLKNVFIIGVVIRLVWAFYGYFFFNMDYYGTLYGDNADTGWYMDFAKEITAWLRGDMPMSFEDLRIRNSSAIDDVGYPFWLSILYFIVGVENDVVVPFIVKCVIGGYCSVLIYRIAKRHFGEGTARLTALFVALNPNMIYWCGTMMKEAEMVFLCCLCVDLVDRTFSSGNKLTFKSLLPGVLVGAYLFFFRSALAIVIFLAMGAHIVMASSRVMSAGKKIIAGTMVGLVLLVGMGDRLRTQAEALTESVQTDKQKVNMEWRSERKDGSNSFAKYASATVFAPLIFTIPFPSFNVAEEGQILQRQLSGGNYIKNIFSFFVILVMFILLLTGEWRKHVFILAYTLGYLITLVLSNFAQSSRFHIPIWPFLMLFAAYGIQLSKSNPKYRRWFTIALIVEVVACLGWNWFKLKGRGMV